QKKGRKCALATASLTKGDTNKSNKRKFIVTRIRVNYQWFLSGLSGLSGIGRRVIREVIRDRGWATGGESIASLLLACRKERFSLPAFHLCRNVLPDRR